MVAAVAGGVVIFAARWVTGLLMLLAQHRPTEPGFGRYALDRLSAVDVIGAYFGADAPAALRVARCESGPDLDPGAVNTRSGTVGLFQIDTQAHADLLARYGYGRDDLLRVVPNVRVAHAIWTVEGWRPWSCRP